MLPGNWELRRQPKRDDVILPRVASSKGEIMKQPLAGLVATFVIVAISLGFISLFGFPMFSGWVGYLMDCIIPMQIVIGVTWAGKHPAFAASRPQPLKGLLFILLDLAVAAVFAALLWVTVGHSINPPTPILIFFMIDFVLTTFWLTIIWEAGRSSARSRMRSRRASPC